MEHAVTMKTIESILFSTALSYSVPSVKCVSKCLSLSVLSMFLSTFQSLSVPSAKASVFVLAYQ